MNLQDLQVLHDQYAALVAATQQYADAVRKCQHQLMQLQGIFGTGTESACSCTNSYICDGCLEGMLVDMEMEYNAQGEYL